LIQERHSLWKTHKSYKEQMETRKRVKELQERQNNETVSQEKKN